MGIYIYKTNISLLDVGKSNGITNYGYLRILQEASAFASASIGYGPNDSYQTRSAWIILNWRLQVFARPKWQTKLTIKTWPRKISKCYCFRDLEVYDESNNLIAIASSKWVLMDIDTLSIKRISMEMEEAHGCIDSCVFDNIDFKNIRPPDNYINTLCYTIQRRDIDTNNHVNNTHYLSYAIECLPKDIYENYDFKNVEIMYKREAKLGDDIICYFSKIENNENIISIKDKNNTLYAIIKLY